MTQLVGPGAAVQGAPEICLEVELNAAAMENPRKSELLTYPRPEAEI